MKKEQLTEEKVNMIPHDVLVSMYVQLDKSFQIIIGQNEELIARVASLEEQLAVLTQDKFGRKTEKLSDLPITPDIPDVDAALNEAEATKDADAPEPEMETVIIRRKKTKGKRAANLRYAEEQHDHHELSEEQLKERFPRGYTRLADDEYTDLEHIPEKFIKHIHHIAVYAGNHGEGVVRADSPNKLIPNSILTPSLAAAVINSKYTNALPLNRLHEEYLRLGVNISRQVMSGWVIRLYDLYLCRIYNEMKKRMFDAKLIHCDETPFIVVNDGRANNPKSYMWVYHTYQRYATPPIYIYEYNENRSSDVPKEFLKNFKGILVTDGYQVYHKIANERPDELKVAGCWIHAKRKFAELVKSTKKAAAPGSVSYEAVNRIATIYHVDNMYKDASNEERLKHRQESVAPLVDAYFSWLGSIDTSAMDQSGKLYKAIQYSLNQEEFLRRFLEDPIIPLDNNDAERSIRKFCVGKHSWHIVSTPDGATASAAMYSIVETAKANGLRPYEYVKYVLEQLIEGTDIKTLVPWSEDLPEYIREYKFD